MQEKLSEDPGKPRSSARGDQTPSESSPAASYFKVGGGLDASAPSYVERPADRELLSALQRREFCYVLDSRQVGKSSMMVRTAAALRSSGFRVAIIDLTSIGSQVTLEQWYYGIVSELGRQLKLEDKLREFWRANTELGPLNRLMEALRTEVIQGGRGDGGTGRRRGDGALPANIIQGQSEAPLVIFIDEVDALLALPFRGDEFLAGIRECYSRRASDPSLSNLTFCIVGSAMPEQLIRDSRTTPFNIGTRIVLTDFTEREAASLASGLTGGPSKRSERDAKSLLARVIRWTGGHPYLTQRLCAAAVVAGAHGGSDIDRVCASLFFAKSAYLSESNLTFVRDRILLSDADIPALLGVYSQVLRFKSHVRDDPANTLCSVLRLSGLVRSVNGFLRVRNRIYATTFNRAWIVGNMPDAEMRRQRAAFWRGTLRTASASIAVLTVVVVLAVLTVKSLHEIRRLNSRLQAAYDELSSTLYPASLELAWRSVETGDAKAASDALEVCEKRAPLWRGFDWRYMWGSIHGDNYTVQFNGGSSADGVNSVSISPDGKAIAAGTDDGMLWLLNAGNGALESSKRISKGSVNSVAFSPLGGAVAIAADDGTISLYSVGSGIKKVRDLRTPTASSAAVCVAISPDGKRVGAGLADHSVHVWDANSGEEVLQTVTDQIPRQESIWDSSNEGNFTQFVSKPMLLKTGKQIIHSGAVVALAFAPDGKSFATGSSDRTARIWSADPSACHRLKGHGAAVMSVAYSRDGSLLATGSGDSTIRIWDGHTGRPLRVIRTRSPVYCLAFSHHGKKLVYSGTDTDIYVLDLSKRDATSRRIGHLATVQCCAFSPDDASVYSGSADGALKDWDLTHDPSLQTYSQPGPVRAVGISTSSTAGPVLLAGGGSSKARLTEWGIATNRTNSLNDLNADIVTGMTVSPDGQRCALLTANSIGAHAIAVQYLNPTIVFWNVRAGRVIAERSPTVSGERPGGTQPLLTAAYSGDGNSVFTFSGGSGSEGLLREWDTVSWRMVASAATGTSALFDIAQSPVGPIIAGAETNGLVSLWNSSDLSLKASIGKPGASARSLAYTPDGAQLYAAYSDNTVREWNTSTLKETARLQGNTNSVTCLRMSPDGKSIATCSKATGVKLWNPVTDKETITLTAPRTDIPTKLAFSADGRYLAAGTDDGRVLLWHAPTFDEINVHKEFNYSAPK